MKVKKAVLSILLLFFVLSLCAVIFVGCSDNSKKYHDSEIYIRQNYLDKDIFGQEVYNTGVGASIFMPKYEEIEYNYSNIDFYIFDGTATLDRTAVTFVLDLEFDNKDEYESAKKKELSIREFMTEYEEKKWHENPVFEFNLGDFLCKTVYHKGYPSRFGLICLNDNNLTLRYLYFGEWESPEYVKDAKYILECTNCPWEN